MSSMQKIKDSPHYLRLKESVQYRYDRKQFMIICAIFGGFFLLVLLPTLPLIDNPSGAEIVWLFLFIIALFSLPFVLYYSYHWLAIFRHIDSYIFCEVLLDQPHVEGRGGVRFTVEFTDRHGKRLKRDTGTLFSSDWEPFLEDYNNQKVLIGYNEETDRVVVIKRTER